MDYRVHGSRLFVFLLVQTSCAVLLHLPLDLVVCPPAGPFGSELSEMLLSKWSETPPLHGGKARLGRGTVCKKIHSQSLG
jgi:hypothetical protein